jgi:hypothetical protein
MNTKQKVLMACILVISLSLFGCGTGQSPTFGQIKGVIVQETSGINMGGTIKLIPEKYLEATPDSTTTLEPGEMIEVSIDNDNKFIINDIKPGSYYLDVTIVLNPCFLGAPGQVFNGMQISFMENWSPAGFSLQDGSSIITGKTDVYKISAGKSVDVTLQLPRCY